MLELVQYLQKDDISNRNNEILSISNEKIPLFYDKRPVKFKWYWLYGFC